MHEKEIEKLQAEKEKVERQLAQEKHKIQRLENRFYALAEQVFALPDAQRLLMEAVSRHAGGD